MLQGSISRRDLKQIGRETVKKKIVVNMKGQKKDASGMVRGRYKNATILQHQNFLLYRPICL